MPDASTWDILIDWGHGPSWLRTFIDGRQVALLRANKGWPMVRPHAHIPVKVSYLLIGFNILARMAWAIYVAPGKLVTTQHTIRELPLDHRIPSMHSRSCEPHKPPPQPRARTAVSIFS